MRFVFIVISLVMVSGACNHTPRDIRTVDFAENTVPGDSLERVHVKEPLKVAVSAMSSPKETFASYEEIIRFVADRLDVPYEFHQRRTYSEINTMLENGQLDFAFICSGAYVELDPESGTEILAVPVTGGKTSYQAYLIVPESSPVKEFADLEGRDFAYTDLLSNTGYLFVRYRLIKDGYEPNGFFGSAVFTNAHDVSIQMVAKGLVDGSSVHSMVFDYLQKTDPDRVRDVRIVEKSEPFGIPPIVSSSRMDNELKEKVQNILLNMHLDDIGREALNKLLYEKFLKGTGEDYEAIRKMRAMTKN